mmetsp:Transcript_34675/g.81777  ORF Transcript_34675/g.81777 Transcript_34675/m.81777 type:complete len:250 (-) Transcript_34675:239-988(-)
MQGVVFNSLAVAWNSVTLLLHITSSFQEISEVHDLSNGNSYYKHCFQDDPPHQVAKGCLHNFSVNPFSGSHVYVVVDQVEKRTMEFLRRLYVPVVLRVNLCVFVLYLDAVFKANGTGLHVVRSSRRYFSSPSGRDQPVLQADADLLVRFEIDAKVSLRGPPSRSEQDVIFLCIEYHDAEGLGIEVVVQVIKVSNQSTTGSPRGCNDVALFVLCWNRYNVCRVDDLRELYNDARHHCKKGQAGGRRPATG